MSFITINPDLCRGCGKCAKDCLFGVLEIVNKKVTIKEGMKDQCVGCGHCQSKCKSQAISLFGQQNEPAPQGNELHDLMKKRRGIRNYKKYQNLYLIILFIYIK